MDGIILKKIIREKTRVEFHFEIKGELREYFTTDTMFIEYDTDITDIPESILVIPFVASILPLMWLTNTVMWVEQIDRTFYNSISRIKNAYQNLYNHYQLKGNFVSAKFEDNTFMPEKENMLLFGGGIDAHTTYIRIKDSKPLLFNIQGWYKNSEDKDKAAEADYRDIATFAKREGVEFSFAKSNFAVLINNKVFEKRIKKKVGDSWWHGFQHSMGFISIAIPLAYKKKIKNIYIASSIPIGEYKMCASYVTTDSEFAFAENGSCVHDGAELTRQDKVHILVGRTNKKNTAYPIRVCSFNDTNCCSCDKCLRSIFEIIAEGGNIKDFGFNIDGSLKEHFDTVMKTSIEKLNISGESKLYWAETKKRMKENYNQIEDKEFVDWFMSYDFIGERKKAVFKYRVKNFWKILKRKLKGD